MRMHMVRRCLLPALPLILLVAVAGCPSVAPSTSPTANAGTDQSVNGGVTVTLSGSATDPAGGALTFAWTQTTGTTVTLTNANTATATFTAPATAATLTFRLTATSSASALSGTDDVNITVSAPTTPMVNAGADQAVNAGVTVTLSGSATDPAAGTPTFAWTQTAGTTVTLTNANTATAVFTAPGTAGTLTFRLTATSNVSNLSGTDDVNIAVSVTTPAVTPQLFIANLGNSVTSYRNPATVNGNIAPDTNLAGANTQLNVPADIVVDALGALLAANNVGASITSYVNATATNGNLAPNRNVQGGNTQLVATGPSSLAVSTTSDVLFVSAIGAAPKILIFTGASTGGFTGNMAPTRVITNAALTQPIGINLDATGNLYVANLATNTILIYANAANLNGNVAPTRTITGNPAFTEPFDVFVDQNDRMFVVNRIGPSRLNIYNNASTLNGTIPPDFTLTVTGATDLTAIAVDSAGRGYLVNRATSTIFSYDGIATLNGARTPDRTIAGPNTLLSTPIRLFLVE